MLHPVYISVSIFFLALVFHGGYHVPPAQLCSELLPAPFVRPPKALFPLPASAAPAGASCASSLRSLIDATPASEWPPPCPAPAPLRAAYQAHGLPFAKEMCLAQRYDGEAEYVLDWSAAFIARYCAGVASGRETGTYGSRIISRVQHAFTVMAQRHGAPPSLTGTAGMVLGSEYPWVECLALNLGADEVLTFEYGTIHSTHPRIKARPVKEIAADFLAARAPPVDWVASFSSLEHSGLGRYGDALNPEGDAEALQQAWCMLKPGGVLLLGVPSVCRSEGYLQFNAHRVYGFERLAHVARGFELLGFTSACDSGGASVMDSGAAAVAGDDSAGRIVLLRKPLSGLAAEALRAEDVAVASLRPFLAPCKH